MKLQKAGAIPQGDTCLLSHDWYKQLSPRQLEDYVRYVFIAQKTKVYSPNATEHRQKKLKWDGGCDNFGTRYKRLWSKIVSAILSNDAVPGLWVAAHFSPVFHAVRQASNKSFIDNRPELLCAPLSIEIYNRYVDSFDKIAAMQCACAEISVATQLKTLDTVIEDPDDRIFYVVSDCTNVNASPFFRHALAAVAGCDRGVKKYQTAATVDYDINQELYDAAVAAPENDWWVSEGLKQNLIRYRKYWSSVDG